MREGVGVRLAAGLAPVDALARSPGHYSPLVFTEIPAYITTSQTDLEGVVSDEREQCPTDAVRERPSATAASGGATAGASAPGPGSGSDPGGAFGWGAGRIIAIVAGALLILISVGLLGVGGVAVWAGFQRDGGYVTTDVQEFSASGSALATDPVDLGSEGVSWVYSSGLPRQRPDPGHADDLRPAAVRRHRPLRRRLRIPRGGEPHSHLRLLGR